MPMLSRWFDFILPQSVRRKNISCYVLFFACVAVLYGRAVFFDITYYDDRLWVKDLFPQLVNGIHWWEFFFKPDLVSEYYYRPLLNLSFVVDARLGHGALWPYHLTNLLLHAVSVCFVFRALQEWGMTRARALAGALIFLVHPALAQAAVWMPGRTDSLLGFFCFAGFFFFLRHSRLNRNRDLAGYAVCLAGALLSKETGIVLAFMAFVMSLFPMRTGVPLMQRLRVPVVTACVAAAWFLARAFALRETFGDSLSVKLRTFADNLPAIWLYLGKAFVPLNLSVFPTMEDSNLIYGALVAAFLIAWFLFVRQKDSIKIFWAILWFICFLLPSLIIGDLKYEYRLYVSLLGAVIIVLELFPARLSRFVFTASAVAVIGIFSIMSWHYSDAYRDQWHFWPRAVEQAPHSPLAKRNLGAMHHVKGDLDTAFRYYSEALTINPHEELANGNVGLLYEVSGDHDKAIEYLKREIRYHPSNYLPYYNLAQIMIDRKRLDDAARLLNAAMVLGPGDADVYSRLIQVYLSQGRSDKAREVFQRLRFINVELPPDISEQAKKLKWI